MKTLRELNEKAWYRLLKVLYVFLYLPCIGVLLLAYDSGKDYHPPVYPNTIVEALNDPEFYKLSDHEMSRIFSSIDSEFSREGYTEQMQFITSINKIDIKAKEFKENTVRPSLDEIYGSSYAKYIVSPRKTPLPQQGVAQKYFYASYFTRSILKTVGYLLITGFCYVLFMEIIRRTFYYVVLGKLFPKE